MELRPMATTKTATVASPTPFKNTVSLGDVAISSGMLSPLSNDSTTQTNNNEQMTTATATTAATTTTDLLSQPPTTTTASGIAAAAVDNATTTTTTTAAPAAAATPAIPAVRSRKQRRKQQNHHHHHRDRRNNSSNNSGRYRSHMSQSSSPLSSRRGKSKCCNRTIVRSTLSCMNLVAKLLIWCSAIASVAAVVWYSYELKNNGTDPHLIAWFSAGAFVLLGFPISMYGITMHLANYNQPNVQCYVVRILWMVPIYSIESWLCLRYKDYAIYIETLRDWYESYVLYSFLQFLIQVLGGEEALILMLKDKSPTRGVHMWGLQYCGVKPWLMGQPVRRTYDNYAIATTTATTSTTTTTTTASILTPTNSNSGLVIHNNNDHEDNNNNPNDTLNNTLNGGNNNSNNNNKSGNKNKNKNNNNNNNNIQYKRVHWTSPFFVYCKFGVLQYVLLKFVCSLVVVVLEKNHIYKEGDFTYKGGYLYICILTNLSQCWALYCLIFFYYATKNELSPIRPVGKFLSVKALVFFTWWQSVCISILYQYNLIPHYHAGMINLGSPTTTIGNSLNIGGGGFDYTESHDSAVALDEWSSNELSSAGVVDMTVSNSTSSAHGTIGGSSSSNEWTPEDVAKGLQDYLICIEMFVAAMVHIFVFSHTEYDPQAVEARERALNQLPPNQYHENGHYYKRLGRKWKDWDNKSAYSGTTMTSSEYPYNNNNNTTTTMTTELVPLSSSQYNNHNNNNISQQMMYRTPESSVDEDDLRVHPLDRMDDQDGGNERRSLLLATVSDKDEDDYDDDDEEEEEDGSFYSMDSNGDENDGDYDYDENDDDDYDDDDDHDEARKLLPSPRTPSSYSPRHTPSSQQQQQQQKRPGFVKALLDSAIPQDLRDNTVGIIKGDYVVERKTLLHHAATSDSYDLFSRVPKLTLKKKTTMTTTKTSTSPPPNDNKTKKKDNDNDTKNSDNIV